MATRIPDDDYRPVRPRTAQPAPRASASGQRPAGRPVSGVQRSAYSAGARPASSASGSRPAARPVDRASGASRSGAPRPAQPRPGGQRPAPRPAGSRPPQRRRRNRRANTRFFLFIAVIVLILVVVIALVSGGKKKEPEVVSYQTQTQQQNGFDMPTPDGYDAALTENVQQPAEQTQDLAAQLANSDSEVAGLAAQDMAQVGDLGVTEGLSEEWLNVLLLGTDERVLGDSCRTDSMIICSINRNTGEVKLSSIMRDTDVEIKGTSKYDGHYRINSANYFGGWKLAVRTVNELLDMNIQYYAMVNFFGFQKIAHILGGIDVDVTEAEMKEINHRIYEQAKMAYVAGIDESDLADENKVYLEDYGQNIHLNGRQTLAYARIRYTDNDYARTGRQQLVLGKLLEKLKTQGATGLLSLATTVLNGNMIKTNMPAQEITAIALKVIANGIPEISTMRIPIQGSYVEERRNDDARLYDTDWEANATELYTFIYT